MFSWIFSKEKDLSDAGARFYRIHRRSIERERRGRKKHGERAGERKSLASTAISLLQRVQRRRKHNRVLRPYKRERGSARVYARVVGSRNSESAIWPARCATAGCHGGVSAARWNWRVLGLVIYMSNYRKSCPNLACFHGLGDILCRSRNTACMRA